MSKSLKICKELALTQPTVFKFQGLKMDSVYAHGANSLILTARVGSIEQGDFFNFLDLTCVPPGAEIGMHTHANDNQEIYIIISQCFELFPDLFKHIRMCKCINHITLENI